MTVKEAFAKDKGLAPQNGMVGKARLNWCDVGTITVKSGKLTAIDFAVMDAASGVTVDVPTGKYLVQVKVMSFDGSLGICAARALPAKLTKADRGPLVGNVSVDIALPIGNSAG
jgi:hypothetical protein